MREIKSKVVIYGVGEDGRVRYSQILDLSEFYDGKHVWDSWDTIHAAGIVRLIGLLFGAQGELEQEWEHFYDPNSGMMTETRQSVARDHLQADPKRQALLKRLNEIRAKRGETNS